VAFSSNGAKEEQEQRKQKKKNGHDRIIQPLDVVFHTIKLQNTYL
jgi:hypothetical protein